MFKFFELLLEEVEIFCKHIETKALNLIID